MTLNRFGRRAAPTAVLAALAATGMFTVTATASAATAPSPTAKSAAQPEKGKKKAKKASNSPIVIGHRGASGYRPEHTLASYELAARMGADCIEPDLVPTKDGVLVARHENEISGTTDVADHAEFADRKTTKTIDGKKITGWFTEDFTLAELRTLRAKERLPESRPNNTIYDGRYQVPTFGEILDLRESLSKELGRDVCVYPETKHPTYFRSIDLGLEEPLMAELKKRGMNNKKAPVYIQSFELTNLQELDNDMGARVPLVFLAGAKGAPYDLIEQGDPRTYADLLKADSLQELSHDIDGIGPDLKLVLAVDDEGATTGPTTLVDDAHAAGLEVHPYTVRAENEFLPTNYRNGDQKASWGMVLPYLQAQFETGIDGIFTDMPDVGVEARNSFVSGRSKN